MHFAASLVIEERKMGEIYTFINLLLVPVVVVYIHYRRKNRKMTLSTELLCKYAFAVSLNTIIARALALVMEHHTGKIVFADRSSFTACALASAIVQPFIWEAGRVFMKFAIMDKGNETDDQE